MTLELAVKNTDEEIEFHKFLNSGLGFYRCRRSNCRHGWKATIGEMMCNPECPKCGN